MDDLVGRHGDGRGQGAARRAAVGAEDEPSSSSASGTRPGPRRGRPGRSRGRRHRQGGDPDARRARQLKARLGAQRGERLGVHARGGAPGASASASIVAMPAARSRSRCTGRMPATRRRSRLRDDLQFARRASSARHDVELAPRVAPCDLGALRSEVDPPVGDEGQEPVAPQREHGEEVIDLVLADRTVAEQQLDPIRARDAEPVELDDVGRELHERGDPCPARELGVLHDPRPRRAGLGGRLTHEEVGEADEIVRRERRLVDDLDALRRQRLVRRRDGACECLGVARPGLGDLDDTIAEPRRGTPRARGVRARRPAGRRARASHPPARRRPGPARVARRSPAAMRTRTRPQP